MYRYSKSKTKISNLHAKIPYNNITASTYN